MVFENVFAITMIVSINGERTDIKYRTAIYLQNIHELGGEANTRDIADRSGLDDWEIREAWKQARDRSLVEQRGYDDASYGPGSDPRLYELTGRGRAVVERGVPGKVIAIHDTDTRTPEQEVNDLKKTISRLERQVKKSQSDEFGGEVEELKQQLETDDGLSDEEVEELRQDLAEFEEYVYEWNEAVETYLYALRNVAERELDVDLDDELESVSVD